MDTQHKAQIEEILKSQLVDVISFTPGKPIHHDCHIVAKSAFELANIIEGVVDEIVNSPGLKDYSVSNAGTGEGRMP